MFESIVSTIPRPPGYDDRARRISVLQAVLDGTMYSGLLYEFQDEKNASGEYVPLRLRKPSVRYNLCRLVVEDSIAMLFGSDRFPTFVTEDENTQSALADIMDESAFSEAMVAAAQIGSTGSVMVMMRVLGNRVFWSVMSTVCLKPEWDPKAPDTLVKLTERYQVRGSVLREQGYTIPDDKLNALYWFAREWDANAETWYLPQLVEDANRGKLPLIDAQSTVQHGLGFVPAVWIKNLPGGTGDDGACTFAAAIETQIEIEYRLSQGGRALQYSSDPLMMIRSPAGDPGGDMVRSSTNAIIVDTDGDAKMLQIDGAATAAVLEFVHGLRELAIEAIHGNRSSADKLSAAQSGRAMELLHNSLIGLVDKLRQSYGRAILRLGRMVCVARQKFALTAFDEPMPEMDISKRVKLRWGPYFAQTLQDKQIIGQTVGKLKDDGLISRETAVERIAEAESIADPQAELALIDADIAAVDARLALQAAQVKATETVEN